MNYPFWLTVWGDIQLYRHGESWSIPSYMIPRYRMTLFWCNAMFVMKCVHLIVRRLSSWSHSLLYHSFNITTACCRIYRASVVVVTIYILWRRALTALLRVTILPRFSRLRDCALSYAYIFVTPHGPKTLAKIPHQSSPYWWSVSAKSNVFPPQNRIGFNTSQICL